MPSSVTKVGSEAIANLSVLETLIMPGINTSVWGNTSTFQSYVKSTYLKTVVVGGYFMLNDYRFWTDVADSDGVKADLFISAAKGEWVMNDAVGYAEDNSSCMSFSLEQNPLMSGKVYYLSDTATADGWHMVDGVPTPWK